MTLAMRADSLKQEASRQVLNLPAYIDSSMLSTWRSCKRKFFWSTLHALSPTSKSIHLVAGGAFAAGMEAARRLVFAGDGANRPSHDDILQAAYPAFTLEWGDYPIAEGENKSFYNTFAALEAYLLQHPPATDAVQPARRPDGSPAVEFTFTIPLEEGPRHPETGDPFLFVGRFDMLGSYNGLPCIVDEKTTSSIGFAWANNWRLRGQFMGYCWACQQLGYNVNTAVIRGVGILKRDFTFATAIEQWGQYEIERWYRQLLNDLHGIVSAYKMLEHWSKFEASIEEAFPYNFADACTAYGGCAYVPLCSARNAEDFFSNYVRSTWNPLAKNPVKEKEATHHA